MDKINKLPKWAQDYIHTIQRERETAIRALNEYVDTQTESPFFIDENECTGEVQGPSVKRRYIQTHKMEIQHEGVHLSIYLREGCVDLQWSDRRFGNGDIAFIPATYQGARLVNKKNMR